ncbi:MAG: ribonuclease BN [Sphingobacteriales bacterium 41-5]|nr:MAG: ribonuclease BN [Sphingobacteriales bacterium 41-5]
MPIKKTWTILKQSVAEIFENRVFKLSAALAYYTLFSLPGLLIVVVWVSEIFWGHAAVENALKAQIASFTGAAAASEIQEVIKNAALFPNKGFSTIIGMATLIFGATGVFAEIQDSINMIWRLKAKPKKGRGWLKLILDRLLSFSLVITMGFLLLVSLVINFVMDALSEQITRALPETQVILAYVSNLVLTFLITSFLFGLIFKILPDARIKWKAVRAGAIVTALLFMLGKFLISYYLGSSRLTTIYGGAGTVIVILLWVYYSSIILYFGAAFTRVFAINNGMNIYPTQYAVWVEQVEMEHDDSIQTLNNDPVVSATHEEEQKNIVNDGI